MTFSADCNKNILIIHLCRNKQNVKDGDFMKFTNDPVKRISEDTAALMAEINSLPVMKLDSVDPSSTAAVFIDIINGFIREGAMSAARIEDIVAPNAVLMKKCIDAGIAVCAFADCHEEDAVEFASFPPHCIKGTSESELVDELKACGGYTLIPKNSTNGYHEEDFTEFLSEHCETDTFIVTGDCTDICVLQFCLALKTAYTKDNRAVRIIIPVNCVETYDAPFHGSDFTNLAAYKLMKDSGITFVSSIE